jgi:predicted enzyme related to lactoylglutathione lyase
MPAQPIVHVEIPANDPRAASTFYADAFGWQIQVAPEFDYHMFQAEGGPGGGFVPVATPTDGGAMQYQPGDVLIYIGSADIDADLQKVESLGGAVVVPKTEIPQTGWFGVFKDPTGNKVALYTSMPGQS